jgi:mannose-6-phosphate isomerase-like protein (cupin superfamily)
VVTGHNAEGESIFLSDGLAPNVKEMASMPGLALTDLWETKGAPARNDGSADNAARPVRLEPPKNGAILRIVEFPPDSQWRNRADARAAFDSIGAGHAPDKHSADPMMHKTATVDYIIVLKGEIYAIMDKGETLLKAGDILVQRGTNHSWSVRSNEPCIIAAILVSAAPLGARRPARKAAKRPAKRPARRRARASASPRAAAGRRGKTGKR